VSRKISILLFALASSAFARQEYRRAFDKTVPVRAGERVSIEHKFGDVVVRTHPQSEVVIHVDIRSVGSDSDEAKMFADRVEIAVDSSASELSIRTRYPEDRRPHFHGRNTSYSVKYDVIIPESSPLEVRDSFGGVSVTGAKAGSEINASYGQIEFRDGRGVERFENSFGGLELANNVGDVTVQGNYGAVDVTGVTGSLEVRNRFGKVTVARVTNGVTVINGNGPVQVTDSGGSGTIRNSFGAVTIRGFRGGPLNVQSSFGAIMLDGISGPLQVENQNGVVDATSTARATCQPIVIRTSFSTLRVRLPRDASYQVSARTSFGRVHTDFPLTVSGSISNNDISGTIGGGRCPLTLTDNNGTIEILKSAP
jgi:DUF4097 and DUF4098 domain-containing protein YvlB